jgi:hypothetical protein
MSSQIRRLVIPVVLSLLTTGCQSEIPYGSVEGVVTVDGKPLPNAEVVFMPDPDKGTVGPRSVAITDRDGHYRIASDKGRDGTPVGFNSVVVNDLVALDLKYKMMRGLVPPTGDDDAPRAPIHTGNPNEQKPKVEVKLRFPEAYTDAARTPFRDIEVKPGVQTIDLKLTTNLK